MGLAGLDWNHHREGLPLIPVRYRFVMFPATIENLNFILPITPRLESMLVRYSDLNSLLAITVSGGLLRGLLLLVVILLVLLTGDASY